MKSTIIHNKEFWHRLENITTAMTKKRLIFYGHIVRMNYQRLTSRIYNAVSMVKAKSQVDKTN